MSDESKKAGKIQEIMPSAEEVQKELAKAKSMHDFVGKEGIFARLFANTIETMLESELSEELGYEPYEAKGEEQWKQPERALSEESADVYGRNDDPGAAGSEWGV
jgi:hypothetical protein